jgi:hypothetical protein
VGRHDRIGDRELPETWSPVRYRSRAPAAKRGWVGSLTEGSVGVRQRPIVQNGSSIDIAGPVGVAAAAEYDVGVGAPNPATGLHCCAP